MRRNAALLIERTLLIAGLALLAVYGLARADSWLSSRLALREFDRILAAGPAAQSLVPMRLVNERVDFSLWSEKRIREYKESLLVEKLRPWGVLAIDKVSIRVPVFDGTDELVLNRGVGWISGTARPGDTGNIGIAGHRDGFFRGLKDVAAGDAITLTTQQEKVTYIVDDIEIVVPERVDVLQPRGGLRSLTLVTCYPFYFVGDAPQRFIVHATIAPPRD
jgi:sortase A